MYGKRTFTAKFGDPKTFLFKGQVWDTRLSDSSPGDRRRASKDKGWNVTTPQEMIEILQSTGVIQ